MSIKLEAEQMKFEDSKSQLIMPQFSSVKQQILEFDMNSIFHLSYSFDVLQKVIDKIVVEVDGQNNKFTSIIDQIIGKVNNHEGNFSKFSESQKKQFDKVIKYVQNIEADLKNQTDKQNQQISENKLEIEELKKAVQENANNIPKAQAEVAAYDDSELRILIESLERNMQDQQSQIKQLDNRHMFTKQSNGGADKDEIEEMINNLNADLRDRYLKNVEFTAFKQRVEEQFQKQDSINRNDQKQIDDHQKTLNALTVKIDSSVLTKLKSLDESVGTLQEDFGSLQKFMITKVDCEIFDEEIHQIKQMIIANNQIAPGTDNSSPVKMIPQISSISSKDLNRIKELEKKTGDLEDILNKLYKDLKTLNINDMKEQILDAHKKIQSRVAQEDLDVLLKGLREDIHNYGQKMKTQSEKMTLLESNLQDERENTSRLQSKIRQIEEMINSLKIDLYQVKNNPLKQEIYKKDLEPQKQSASQEELAQIYKKIAEQDEAIAKFRVEFIKNTVIFQEQIANKVGMDALQDLEQKLLEKLNELFQALVQKFADKKETKANLKLIESQLKNLYDLCLLQNPKATNQDNEEDAMFAKKPLGGWSCASCEKNLTNLQGHLADYQPWSKLPFKDPNERLSKYGAGFSKILSMMKPPDYQSQNGVSLSQMMNHSQNNMIQQSAAKNNNASITEENPLDFNSTNYVRGSGTKTAGNFYKINSETILPSLKQKDRKK